MSGLHLDQRNRTFRLFIIISICFFWITKNPYAQEIDIPNWPEAEVCLGIQQRENGPLCFLTEHHLIFYYGNYTHTLKVPTENQNKDFLIYREGILIGTIKGEILNYSFQLNSWSKLGKQSTDSNGISKILEYHNTFFICTRGDGLFYWNPKEDYVSKIEHFPTHTDIFDACIVDGNLYLATEKGVIVFDMLSKNIIRNLGTKEGLLDPLVLSITSDKKSNLYIGTHERGIYEYTIGTQSLKPLSNLNTQHPIDGILYTANKLWFIDSDQHYKSYSLSTRQTKALATTKINPSIGLDQFGSLWMYLNTNRFYRIPLFVDEEMKFQHEIQAMCTMDSSLILAFPNKLIQWSILDPKKEKILLHEDITSLYNDPHKRIWAGSSNHGLFIFDPNKTSVKQIRTIDGQRIESVTSIDGNESTIWLGTLAGLYKINYQANLDNIETKTEYYNSQNSMCPDYIYQVIARDLPAECWIASDGNGLVKFDNGQFKTIVIDSNNKAYSVYAMSKDSINDIYYAVHNKGLYRIKENETQARLISNSKQDYTALCLNHMNYLYAFALNEIHVFKSGKLQFEYFLSNTETNVIPYFNHAKINQDGELYSFLDKSVYKLAIFDSSWKHCPSIEIREMVINGKKKLSTFDKSLKLEWDENNLEFRFIITDFIQSNLKACEYKLSGLDEDWKITRESEIYYQNLKPGDYILTLRPANSECKSESSTQNIAFTIKMAWWKSLWFIGATFLVVLVSLLYYLKWREKRIVLTEEIKQESIKAQLSNLQNKMNPHFLFNSFNTLISLIEEKSEEASSYAQDLADFYRLMLSLGNQNLISIKDEWELMLKFVSILKKRFGEQLIINTNGNQVEGFVIPLSFQLLVENAVKHNQITKVRALEISIKFDAHKIIFENIKQPKINKEISTGFGLNGLIKRYRLLTGETILVENLSNVFRVHLPVIYKK